MRTHRAAAILVGGLLLAGCGLLPGGDAPPVTQPDPGGVVGGGGDGAVPGVKGADADAILQVAPGHADGPGITIDEALAFQGPPGPLLVNGALFVDPDGRVLLCSAIAESFPPQCGSTRLEVRGLDLASVPDLQEENGVRWADSAQVFGTLAFIES